MNPQRQRWQVLASGIFSLLLAMGVARFSYTPLLPLMQKQAGLGVADAGWLAAINYLGYLSGAVVASLMNDLRLKDRLYRLGLVVALVATGAMGLSTDFTVWALARFCAGLGTAAGMLLGTGLILNWLIRHDHRSELGIHFSGIGLSIAGSAAAVELMSRWLDWRGQWLAFAAIGTLLLIPALRWLPRPEAVTVTRSGAAMADRPPSRLFLRLFMASYFCAGVGYVVSATFIVAIVNHLPGLAGAGTWVFLVLGLAAVPTGIAWDRVARRLGDLNALILATVIEIAGILLPVVGDGIVAALAGAALFGATTIGCVSLVLTMAGRYYPTRPAKMMGRMTVAYGMAQIIAPAVTGWLAADSGSYDIGLYLAAAVMALGAALLVALKAIDGGAGPAGVGVPVAGALAADAAQ